MKLNTRIIYEFTRTNRWLPIIAVATQLILLTPTARADSMAQTTQTNRNETAKIKSIELGPRPFYLTEQLESGPLKSRLQRCALQKKLFKRTDFSIGHRGAPLQFPEHTKESYLAAAKMGAGILECDVTFTKDRALVCRHSQCDLHTTTNILSTPLAEKCSIPFSPASLDVDGNLITPATAKCCTSDITVAEFKTLKGKMDASNLLAKTVEEYQNGTASWRTDLYTPSGTLMTHAESIQLFKSLKIKMTPELKSPAVEMPYEGEFTQQDYAQQMLNEYKAAGVSPKFVFPQSFNLEDLKFWIQHEPDFGRQSVYLDGRYDSPDFNFRDPGSWTPSMEELVADGIKTIAPPMWMLLDLDPEDNIVPSDYAEHAKAAGLGIITWTLERSGLMENGGGWYYQSIAAMIESDSDTLKVLDVLAQQVGIKGIFSDWPATTTFYGNCSGF